MEFFVESYIAVLDLFSFFLQIEFSILYKLNYKNSLDLYIKSNYFI
jgi:hypothetical protein